MKRLTLLLLGAGLLSACSYIPFVGKDEVAPEPVVRKVVRQDPAGQPVVVDGVAVQKVAFRAGASTAAVEQLARAEQCRGGQGAGLVTEPGPVEVYRMECDNGKVFMARCELRQCKPMHSKVAGR